MPYSLLTRCQCATMLPSLMFRGKENRPGRSRPEEGAQLPPEMADFLRGQEYACFFHGTDQDTVAIVKLPTRKIASLRGPVPIHIGHELYDHPATPVIRTVITVFDGPDTPLKPRHLILYTYLQYCCHSQVLG